MKKRKKRRGTKRRLVIMMLLSVMLLLSSSPSLAIGTLWEAESTEKEVEVEKEKEKEISESVEPSTQEKGVESDGEAVKALWNTVGLDEASVKKASITLKPGAVIVNYIVALMTGLTAFAIMLITTIDLVYIGVPPLRDFLDGGMQGEGQLAGSNGAGDAYGGGGSMYGGGGGSMYGGGGGSMYGGGGMYGGNQGGYGRRGNNPPVKSQQFGGGLSAVGRLVSDEAISACAEIKGGVGSNIEGQTGTGGGMKTIIYVYMKKRSIFLICLGVCTVLFTTTIFTEVGIKIGIAILGFLAKLV